MTIDEAIAKYKEITNIDSNCPAHCNISCDKCVQESRQLAEWLEELKSYRASVFSGDMTQSMLEDERNNAIDDLVTEICKKFTQEERNGNVKFYACNIKQCIADLGEQLKSGK